MKLSILFPITTVLVSRCFALPAPIPIPAHVPISQDPSPPRPFLKYPLILGNPLEEREPSALSRFPTDGDNEGHDPSPPRPFPAGRIIEVKSPSPPLEERDPLAPHMLVDGQTASTDPSPPRPFPKYALDAGNPLEERDPLSRFPTTGEKETLDPSPPRPFPNHALGAGNSLEERDPLSRFPTTGEKEIVDPSPPRPFPKYALDAGNPIEERDPLSWFPTAGEKEIVDPSPPRPFPAGRVIDVEASSPNDIIEPRSPLPLLRTIEGSDAEANDPSPPRPFPAGRPVDVEPRAEDIPSHRGHGGYFPPSNPPVQEPTAPTMEAYRIDPVDMPLHTERPHECAPNVFDCYRLRELRPSHHPLSIDNNGSPTLTASISTPNPKSPWHDAFFTVFGRHIPHHSILPSTASPNDHIVELTLNPPPTPTPQELSPTAPPHHDLLSPIPSKPCTTTMTSLHFHPLNRTGPSTIYKATVTVPHRVNCGGCVLTVTQVDIGNGPPVMTSRATVTDAATKTEYMPWCSRSSARL